MRACSRRFHTVNGLALPVYGKVAATFELGGSCYTHTFIITDLPVFHGLFGLDFIDRFRFTITSGTLWLGRVKIDLIRIEDNGVRLVCSSKRTVILPGKEVLIPVKRKSLFKQSSSKNFGDLMVIEPFPGLTQDFGCLAAAVVAETKGQACCISLANLSDKAIIIPRGTSLGFAFPIDAVQSAAAPETDFDLDSAVHAVYSDSTGFGVASVTESQGVDLGPCGPEGLRGEPSRVPDHVKPMLEKVKAELNTDQYSLAEKLISSYADVFAAPGEPLGRTTLVEHSIDTQGHPPIRDKMRRYPYKQLEIMNKEVDRMLEQDVIEPSMSPWSSAIVVVTKKDGSARMCLDVRRLNKVTKKDAYPIPRIRHALESLNGARWFCTVDLQSGYWQLPLAPADKEKSAFSIPLRGHFQFKVMPFGLCNAPASFERLMEQVLSGLQNERCLVYLDDIIVAGKTVEETVENFEKVLVRLRKAGLKLKPSKCTLFAQSVRYLGHVVSADGIACDPDKIACVKEWPIPKNVHDVRSFLGLAGYYREHMDSFSLIAEPMFRLTRKGVKFVWSDACQEAFDQLKQVLTSAPVLAYPDFEKEYILDTDASLSGIGAVLSQIHNGKERVVAYASKTLNKAQRNYCTTRRELLAVVTFVKHFRHYLYGTKFLIRTDHASLRWLTNFRDPEGVLARWLTTLETYNFEIQHRQGRDHSNADGLSRRSTRACPREDCDDCLIRRKPKSGVPQKNHSSPVAGVSVVSPDLRAETASSDFVSQVDVAAILSFSAMTWEELAVAQKDDLHIGPVYKWKEERTSRPTSKDVEGYDSAVRNLWGQWDLLVLDQGVLCRKMLLGSNTLVKQVVLPLKLRKILMAELHDAPCGGHRGIKKTLQSLQSRVYWPGQRGDVRRWCQTCQVCQTLKPGNQRRRFPLQQRLPGYPLERVAMDIMGPIRPPTKNGNSYILVVEDYFSKFVEAYPLKDHTAQTVADVFVSEWVVRYGVGKELHTDQGAEFESLLFKEILKLLGIKKTRTAPYRPQSDGTVERVNRTLKAMLSAYVYQDYETWDEYLPYVLLSYRSTVHESTGCTPNLLFLNRECNLPADLFFEAPTGSEGDPCPHKFVEWMKEASRQTHQFVQQKLKGAHIRQKRNYDKFALERSFSVGDLVYREYLPQANSHKFAHPWKGPYRVLEVIGDVNYKIAPVSGGSSVVVHVDHLKLCLIRPEEPVVSSEDSHSSDGSASVESEGEESTLVSEHAEVASEPADSDSESNAVSEDSTVAVPEPAVEDDRSAETPEVRTRSGRKVVAPTRMDL